MQGEVVVCQELRRISLPHEGVDPAAASTPSSSI